MRRQRLTAWDLVRRLFFLAQRGKRSHTVTQPQSVGLWTRDRLVAQTSTWKHATLTIDIHASGGIRTRNPSKRAAADPPLRPLGHGIILLRHKRRLYSIFTHTSAGNGNGAFPVAAAYTRVSVFLNASWTAHYGQQRAFSLDLMLSSLLTTKVTSTADTFQVVEIFMVLNVVSRSELIILLIVLRLYRFIITFKNIQSLPDLRNIRLT